MNRQEYLNKRNSLLEEAQAMVNEGKFEEAEAKAEEVKALDVNFEKEAKAAANLNALKGNFKVESLENKSVEIKVGKTVETLDQKIENIYATEDYRNGFLKRLQGRELTQQENTAVSGQSVIPTVTMNKIIEKLEQTSVLYNRITVTNFPNKLSIPRENAKEDASWLPMADSSTPSADSFDYISLSAYKLIKTIEIEADVQAMSIDMFEGFIVNALAKKMSKAIENAILNGTASNQPTGLLKAGEITNTGTYTKAGMTYQDVLKIIAALPTPYRPNAVFVTNSTLFFGEILGMTTATGEPVIVRDPQSPTNYSIMGYPVVVDDYVGTDKLLFGDLSYYYFNWAKNIEITSDASVSFKAGNVVYRGLALADGKTALAEAFTLYTRAS